MKNIHKILLIEDDPEDAQLVKRAINKSKMAGIEVIVQSTLSNSIHYIANHGTSIDVIISDLHLGDCFGLNTIQSILKAAPKTPIIVLSGMSNSELALEAVAMGAQDYISKSEVSGHYITQKIVYAFERQKLLNELNDAKIKLKEHSEFKNRFFAQMSHEIRTPMNGVIGNTSLLLQSKLNEEQREIVESIQSSGEGLIQIINDILDISKFESGTITLRPTEYNVRRLIEEVIEALGPLAEEKGILLTNIVDSNVPKMGTLDCNRLKQILFNLVSNGIKFTEEGHVCVQVVLKDVAGSSGLQIIVEDTGIGMSEENTRKIFAEYTQNSYQDQFTGTGLGLAICTQFTNLLGGSITVDSTLGKGSRFILDVPCEFGDVPHEIRSLIENKKVLICGDNEENNRLVAKQFENRGLKVWVSNRNVEDVMELKNERIDWVIINSCHGNVENISLLNHWLNQFEFINSVPRSIIATRMTKFENMHTLPRPLCQSKLYKNAANFLTQIENCVAPNTPQKPKEKKLSFEGISVLIVDDLEANSKLCGKMVSLFNANHKVAMSGQEALDICKNEKFDLIFMDCKMPEMSGFEATQRLRRLSGLNQETHIVALTANADEESKLKCKEAGMNSFLSKPIRIKDMEKIFCSFPCLNKKSKSCEQKTTQAVTRYPKENIIKILNNSTLEELRSMEEPEDEVSFLDDLIQTFEKQSVLVIKDLFDAMDSKELRKMEHNAHKLKGFSRNLGADSLAEVCELVEQNHATLSDQDRIEIKLKLKKRHEVTIAALNENWKRAS